MKEHVILAFERTRSAGIAYEPRLRQQVELGSQGIGSKLFEKRLFRLFCSTGTYVG